MKQTVLAMALLGMGIGASSAAPADLAGGLAAYEASRCDDAVRLITPVAEAGDAEAQKALADVYDDYDGHCRRESDPKAAESWYLRAARAGNVAAQRKLIDNYEFRSGWKKPDQATFWMAKVAALGGAQDLSRLAARYAWARGVPHELVLAYAFDLLAVRRLDQNDQSEKKELADSMASIAEEMSPEQLAEAERIAADWKVGEALPTTSTTGRRDPRDWYVAAAKAGDLDAAHKAGKLYWRSIYGLTAQPELATFWLRKAAQGGIADAQYQLAEAYTSGYGVPKDYVLAVVLYRLAAKAGSKEALKFKDAWDDTLTAQQLSEGTALIAKWKKGDAFPLASRYGKQRKVNYVDEATGWLAPTPEVLALFKAASEGEEAEFKRLLPKVGRINEYRVEDQKLLHALLLPSVSLRKAGKTARDQDQWHAKQARHAALLPAKTRMLALALQRGAGFNEGTPRDHAAALHLAAMFGTPEMVRLLLKHGADPRQFGGQNNLLAPLEFSLEQKEHAGDLPELITPEQRTANILALLKADALRPYIRYDINNGKRKEGDDTLKHPFADYLLWPKVVSLTTGTEVLDALLKTGTSPAELDEGKTLFGYAAEAGNADAIVWLQKRLPRYGKNKRDLWLDAAILAMYSSAPGRDKVLQQLLVKDMDWTQSGPDNSTYGKDETTLYAGYQQNRDGVGTLLNHTTRAGRIEWIPRMAALGAPVNTGGSIEGLKSAVSANDTDGVKVLLAQGADPLSGDPESALTLALKAPAGKDAMLDLLLDHVVRVQKRSLAEMRRSPLEGMLSSADGMNLPRVRKLLDAGAPVKGLGWRDINGGFTAPDRNLASLLIQRGYQDKTDNAGTPSTPSYLFNAIQTGRTDLLPEILARGEDPNRRPKPYGPRVEPSAVEFAISEGKLEALKVLLANGGVIDTTSAQPWGTALDRAVLSRNVDVLRLVSKDFSLPLTQVCFTYPGHLAKVVLESPAGYWALLREHGFAKGGACKDMRKRLVEHLASPPDWLLAGWIGRNLVDRLPQLAPRREAFDADTWKAVAASTNASLKDLLAKAGWKAPVSAAGPYSVPQQDKAADRALQAKLPGHYYLKGVREVGAEILLHPDGKFQYSMSYGAVDEFAQGSWEVWNEEVVFRAETAPVRAAAMRPSADAPAVALAAGQVLVDLRHDGASIPDFRVVVLGDAPLKSEGRTGERGWRTAFNGPVRQIAVSHVEVNHGRWEVYNVPAADALRGSYQLDFEPPAAAPADYDFVFGVHDGSLMLMDRGREMRFDKSN
ncbi:hypothetical protein GTP81_08650 [Rugamonas sp. FT107W]|uniref:Sel1 repeat family protein n=1 Tax=Duganella vulcania TaxID=2692166 RepID=A0A845HDD1_9BURK|nr:SEL1-like repeat protein [Duganella vulcania]MYN16820.1 hypothetical protein [Duganella vulcania]